MCSRYLARIVPIEKRFMWFSEHVRFPWHVSEHRHARTDDLSSRNVLRDRNCDPARCSAITKIGVAGV